MGKRRIGAFAIGLCGILVASLPGHSAENYYSRRVEILGWSPHSDRLLYEEETAADETTLVRAVYFDTVRNKLAREFPLQGKDDPPETAAEHQRALASFIEKEDLVAPKAAIAFAQPGREGFLSPDGLWLIQPRLHLKARDSKKTLQRLTIEFHAFEFATAQEKSLAELEIDNLDGEHPLNLDSLGNVSVGEMLWGRNRDDAAVVVQESRPRFRVQGVFALRLPLPEAAAPTQMSDWPTSVSGKSTAASASSAHPASEDLNPLRRHHAVGDGEAMALDWNLGSSVMSNDGRYVATSSLYTACSDQKAKSFSSQVTVFDREAKTFEEFPLATSISGPDLSILPQQSQFEVHYLGETLRTIVPSQTPKSSAFAVQIASLVDEAAAKEQMKNWCAKGLPAYYVAVPSGGKTLYRVRVGRFNSAGQAKRYARAHFKTKSPKPIVTRF